MHTDKKERRRYCRYETEAQIYFSVKYDLNTKVSFTLVKQKKTDAKKYQGITRNISVEGLRFSANKKLKVGDQLSLELYLPAQIKPVCMTGEVRWVKSLSSSLPEYKYEAGVRLLTVMKKALTPTIHFDKDYNVYWSLALDLVLGSFRQMVAKIRGKSGKMKSVPA